MPSDSLIIVTFNTSYMENMKTLVVTRRTNTSSPASWLTGKVGDSGDSTTSTDGLGEACTIALFNGSSFKQLEPTSDLPPACAAQRLALLNHSVSASITTPTITLAIAATKLSQTGDKRNPSTYRELQEPTSAVSSAGASLTLRRLMPRQRKMITRYRRRS